MTAAIHIDGAARGNPGPAGIGVVIKDGTKILKEIAEYLGETTNNIAEYKALIRGLEAAVRLKLKEVKVYSDSELLVRQMSGEYRVKNAGLIPLHHKAALLRQKFEHCAIIHVTRDKNKHADNLANQGIDLR